MLLRFLAKVCDGAGRFAEEIEIPSPVEGLTSVEGWPSGLVRGTFNIQVQGNSWPEIEGLDFRRAGVQCLDRSSVFSPALYLDHSFIPNNTLNPNNKGEFGGDLQFWRAELSIANGPENLRCYMLRRVGSGYRDKIELVSDVHFRREYQVESGREVSLVVYDRRP